MHSPKVTPKKQQSPKFDLHQYLPLHIRQNLLTLTFRDSTTDMKTSAKKATEQMIDELVAAYSLAHGDARARYVFTESLRGLVRLAKSEQLLEIRQDVNKAIGNPPQKTPVKAAQKASSAHSARP